MKEAKEREKYLAHLCLRTWYKHRRFHFKSYVPEVPLLNHILYRHPEEQILLLITSQAHFYTMESNYNVKINKCVLLYIILL